MQPTNQNSYQTIRMFFGAMGLALLAVHFYYYCYLAFDRWNLTKPFIDQLVANCAGAGIFHHRATSKLYALFLLIFTLVGIPAPGRMAKPMKILYTLSIGFILYLGSDLVLLASRDPTLVAGIYIIVTLTGLSYLYSAARSIAGMLQFRLAGDIFNRYNESFPQEERWISGPYVLHLNGRYRYRNQHRDSVVNLPDIFRGTLIMGIPGSGKTRHIFRPLIQQCLHLGMAAFVYDLKYDDLTRFTYNTLLNVDKSAKTRRAFYSMNFDDLSRSHRCNPLEPEGMEDISDAMEAARTILYALNRKWIGQQGDFFIDSAISFCAANIWFLRRYEDGRYCTLPHLIELMQGDFYQLFSVLRSYPELHTLMEAYTSALRDHTLDQLQGQVATARIALATLASPKIYYLFAASDFSLDINNPEAPKVVCVGSNPQRQLVYGAVISLVVTRMLKLVNRKGGVPCVIPLDEFPSIYPHGIHLTVAQARSNQVALMLGIQDVSQLRMEYGRDLADAIFNLPGNLICGQVSGDSARLVSERFGKILQEKNSVSSNSRDSSTSQSHQLDLAVPPSKISHLSSGEFVGITADTPDQPMGLKGFHCRIPADNKAIKNEEASWKPLPEVSTVTKELIEFTFNQIKKEARLIIEDRYTQMTNTPQLSHLIVRKKGGGNNQRGKTQ